MIVTFTGTRKGMSPTQKRCLRWVLSLFEIDEFHHGDAIGADREAAKIAQDYIQGIMAHPARKGTELKRNREMVALAEMLIASPLTDKEQRRSGTWATIRYARKKGIPIIMLAR